MSNKQATAIALLAVSLMAVFFLYPAGAILGEAFGAKEGRWTLDYLMALSRDPLIWEGLCNATLLGFSSTLATLALAFPLALATHRYEFTGKNLLCAWLLVPLVMPPFVGAVGIKSMLGVDGALNALLIHCGWMQASQPYDWMAHGRFFGMVVMNALHLYPILYMNILAALGNLDPAMEQAAHNLGCSPQRRFWKITLPLAMPGVFAGASVVFIWSFTELGVPLVFDFTRIASVQIYDGIKDLGSNPLPYALVAVMMMVAALVFLGSKWLIGRSPLGTAPRPKGRSVGKKLAPGKGLILSLLFCLIALAASLPHIGVLALALSEDWHGTVLPHVWTLHHFEEALGHSLVVPSIQKSLYYAAVATAIDVVLGLAVAWVLVRSRIWGRGLLDALVMLPLAVPGLVMAFGYLALSQPGRPFAFLMGAGGDPALLLIVAYAFRRLPYIVRAAVAGLQQSNPVLEQAGQSLGAPAWRVLWRISLPLISLNLVAGAVMAFAFAMLEVSDSLILAQQAEHFPITKAMYALLGTLGNGTSLAAALGVWAMLFLAVALMGAMRLASKRGGLFRV